MSILTTLTLTAAALPTSRQDDPLFAAVPEEAHALLWCDDFRRFRERAAQNDWVRLLGSPAGGFLLEDLRAEQARATGSEGQPVEDLARMLDGPILSFFTVEAAGLWMRTPSDPEALLADLRELSARPADLVGTDLEIAGAQVELWRGGSWLPTPPEARGAAWIGLVTSERWTGLLRVPDDATLRRYVTRAMAGADVVPVVEGFRAARAKVGPTGGIEAYVDFTPFAHEASEGLGELAEGRLTDPGDLLGLDEGSDAYATFDVRPGTDLGLRGHVRVPRGTLLADLADTFLPLPADLMRSVPSDAFSVHALRWDLGEAWSRARAALEAAEEKESLQAVDAGLAAAEGATGVDPFDDLVAQFAGNFLMFWRAEPFAQEDLRMDGFEALGMWFDVRDATAFQDTFETLIDLAAGFFELSELAGGDAYLVAQDESVDGGFVLWPEGHCALAPLRSTLEGVAAARGGEEGASLLDTDDAGPAFDGATGTCAWSWMELSMVRRLIERELAKPLVLPSDQDGNTVDPFDSQVVVTVRRTADGFDVALANHR